MGRPRKAETVKVRFQLSLQNAAELDKRYSDPSNAYGLKYGARSELINKLLSEHFRAHPVVSLKELESAQ